MKFSKLNWLVITAIIISIIISACNIGATPPPTEDTGAIQTQAFEIVLTQSALQQTQTAAAIPPTAMPTNTFVATITLQPTSSLLGATNTPFSLNTQQPGLTPQLLISPTSALPINTITTENGCNNGAYLGETKPFDGDSIKVGKEFSKGWTILNTGTCTWDEGYVFDYLQDYFPPETNISQLAGYDIPLKKNTPEEYTKPGHSQSFIVKLKAPTTAGQYKGYWKMKDDAGNYFGPLVYVWIIVVP
jgi:hypothetical protein